MFLVVLLFLIALCIGYYYKNVYQFNKKLERFPVPPSMPILGHALDFVNKDHLYVLLGYIRNFGDTVRIKTGPRRQILFTADPKLIEFILTNTKLLDKSLDYKNLSRWLGTGLLTGAGPKWKRNRSILTPSFHFEILKDFVPVYEKNVKVLCNILSGEVDKTIDIYPLLSKCMLDIICETAMGTNVKVQTNPDSEYLKACNVMCHIIVERAFSPHKMFDTIYYFTEDFQREKKALKVLHTYTRNVITTRKEQRINSKALSGRRKAFLDLLLDSDALTFDELCEEVDTFMFAGHHTTSTAISFVLYSLAENPDIQEKVYQEQCEIMADEDISNNKYNVYNLKEMKYLENVIKESLRLYPSVPFYARELKEDVKFQDGVLPAGLNVTMFAFGLQRNPKFFTDPDKFDPERFNTGFESPFVYLPFSAGPRNCIGQKFALFAIKAVVSEIVQHFELISDPNHQLKLAAEVVLASKTGIQIKLKKRTI